MNPLCPQLAFNEWLSRNVQNLVAGMRRDPNDAFLAGAVDHADLERRQRAIQYGQPVSLFR
jgi:hypothetical protein